MTKADLVAEVAKNSDFNKTEAEILVQEILDNIVESLQSGEKVELRGFGSFRFRQRKPRIGRNPKTGEKVHIPAKKVPYFTPAKALKELVNS